MAEATPSLSPKRVQEILQRQRHAVITLAIQRAKKAIMAQLQARGEKVAHYSAKDITLLAEAYLAQHRHELVVEAIAIVECWTAQGYFGKRAQRAGANINNSVKRRRSQIQWVRLCRY
jgi:hypothetical protein